MDRTCLFLERREGLIGQIYCRKRRRIDWRGLGLERRELFIGQVQIREKRMMDRTGLV